MKYGSAKRRFRQGDILLARIMPSLANKKMALVTQDVARAVASTEFYVLRARPDSRLNWYYLFKALRSDDFTRQAVAGVTGATGRQRLSSERLRTLQIPVAPAELQARIGQAVEAECAQWALAEEYARRAEDEATPVLGATTVRTAGPASQAHRRRPADI